MRDLIAQLSARPDPALVFLAESGERLELTGRVSANWVYKTAGLLGELGVGPQVGFGVVCPSPPHLHWRVLAAMLAAWSLGAQVSLLDPHGEPPEDEWVAMRPEHLDDSRAPASPPPVDDSAAEVLVYATGALALSAEAPAGCIDYNSAVRAYPDVTALGAPTHLDLVDVSGEAHRIPVPEAEAGAGARVAGAGGATGSASAGESAPGPDSRTADTSGTALLAGLPRSADEWSELLNVLIRGTLILTDIADDSRLQRRLDGEQVVHGTIGTWTK
ncbi:hypothetical protein GCM10022261_26480 [Brevibacterium daeguense]|uniref:TIGR03089 family protein n=1 Tax=Brevibacterium daeguense TaxID=909936 RepID=A0ABP8EMB5_9MICO|nr:TIGR03089 family protein [Brevibacterium daeguense]